MGNHPTISGNILGLDLGTSGIRVVIVTPSGNIQHENHVSLPFPNKSHVNYSEQSASVWHKALENLLIKLSEQADLSHVKHIIADATSSTLLVTDDQNNPTSPALMYNDARATAEARMIAENAPRETAAHGATSSLAKALWLEKQFQQSGQTIDLLHLCHQIDWLNQFFTQKRIATDANNALKMGYDVVNRCWPSWVSDLTNFTLPDVVMPGNVLGKISTQVANQFGFHPQAEVHAGTTDSIAAFLASGAKELGDAVSSLGSTLSLKLLTDKPVFNAELGVYSHILGNKWLIGGASNAGGAVLLNHFSLQEIQTLLPEINLSHSTGLNYYPLNRPGERFPVSAPDFQPRLSPRPQADSVFLQGMLEGLVQIEQLGYQRLTELGGGEVKQLYAAGGGTQNQVWMTMREQVFSNKIKKAARTDAAFGVTQLLLNPF